MEAANGTRRGEGAPPFDRAQSVLSSADGREWKERGGPRKRRAAPIFPRRPRTERRGATGPRPSTGLRASWAPPTDAS